MCAGLVLFLLILWVSLNKDKRLKSPKVSYKKCYDLLFENESVQCASERFS